MKYILICLVGLLYSCSQAPSWQYQSTYSLDDVNPIGLATKADQLWISDSDHNKIVQVDAQGAVIHQDTAFDRPMHIAGDATNLYVPEYGIDQITVVNDARASLPLTDSLDAPAPVDVADGKYAIADFYNHRIIYGTGTEWITFGQEGNARGELYYPTDVQIYGGEIYVADAYNNRVQVFNTAGEYQRLFGVNEEMNAATGLYIHDGEVFITDFENDRVLIYTTDGALVQILEEGLEKPADMIWYQDHLYIANYKGKNLMTFIKK